jgi:hypothetical protein
MGCYALIEGCFAFSFINIFPETFQHRRGLFQQNKAKTDDILRQPTLANTKSREETLFYPKERPVLATSTVFALTQPIYPPVGW